MAEEKTKESSAKEVAEILNGDRSIRVVYQLPNGVYTLSSGAAKVNGAKSISREKFLGEPELEKGEKKKKK